MCFKGKTMIEDSGITRVFFPTAACHIRICCIPHRWQVAVEYLEMGGGSTNDA